MLSFDNAPPLSAPLRFFLSAPLFAVAAGLLVAWEGPAIFDSRWMPGALAATHLMTVGFMLQVMLGALIQILPVVAGASIARPLTVAWLVHVGLTLGVLLLAAGFYFGMPGLLNGAVLALGLAILVFLGAAGHAMAGLQTTSPTQRGLQIAMIGLAVAVALGCLLALTLSHGWSLPLPGLADLHAGWGLGVWAGVLLAAVAYVVVPMFQLTPGYPARLSWWLPVLLLAGLLVWSLALIAGWSGGVRASQGLVAATGLVFAGLTLRLQSQRRRARADVTLHYWQLGLLATILALIMLLTVAIQPAVGEAPQWALLFGIVLIAGGFVPFIVGMLYRIVPFLAWQHLQLASRPGCLAPSMNKILPDLATGRQMRAYLAAFALLLGAAFWPDGLARIAGIAYALACAGMWFNLMSAFRRYRQHAVAMKKVGAGR